MSAHLHLLTCVIRTSTTMLSHTMSCSTTCMIHNYFIYCLTQSQSELASQLPHASWTSAHEISPHQNQSVHASFSPHSSISSSLRSSARHLSATSERNPPKSSMSANRLSRNSQSFSTSSQCLGEIVHLSGIFFSSQ
jgi:hypothetical protein